MIEWYDSFIAGDRIIQPGTELILAETGPLAGRYILIQPLGYSDVRAKILEQKPSVYTMRFLSHQIVQTLAFAHAKGLLLQNISLKHWVFTDATTANIRFRPLSLIKVCPLDKPNPMIIIHTTERMGCLPYLGPEFLMPPSGFYAEKPAEIWQLGITLYALIFQKYPFQATNAPGLINQIRQGRIVFHLQPQPPAEGCAKILHLLRMDPTAHPAAADLLSRPRFMCAPNSAYSMMWA